MKIVVGLGNPGRKYQGTRHNVGFDVLAELSSRHNAGSSTMRDQTEIREIFLDGEKVLLCAPHTYMNLSGQAVAPLVKFYKLPLNDLLVISDDLNLSTGQLRLRASGSSGGQKGIRDIAQKLGTEEFARLRFGIGRPPGRVDVSAYVLQKFFKEEQDEVKLAVQHAADAVECWVREGIVTAMNQYNSKKE